MRKVLVGLLVVGAAAGALYFVLQNKGVVLDSQAVEKMAAEMLPGAKPPTGLKGVLGLHPEGLEVAIFAPSLAQAKAENLAGSDLRIILARPTQSDPPSASEISAKIRQAQKQKQQQMDTLDSKPTALKVAGKLYPGLESQLSLKESGAKLRENVTVLVVQKKPVVVMITGPEASFNRAVRDEFLSNLAAPEGPAHPSLPSLPMARPTPGDPPKLPKPPSPAPLKLPPKPAKPAPPPRLAPVRPPRPKIPRPAVPRPDGPLGPPSGPPGPPQGPPGF